MRDALPAAELEVLRPGGHMANWEQHPRFVAAVAAFSERCLAAAAGAGEPAEQLEADDRAAPERAAPIAGRAGPRAPAAGRRAGRRAD
jgi:hypothetical protein